MPVSELVSCSSVYVTGESGFSQSTKKIKKNKIQKAFTEKQQK